MVKVEKAYRKRFMNIRSLEAWRAKSSLCREAEGVIVSKKVAFSHCTFPGALTPMPHEMPAKVQGNERGVILSECTGIWWAMRERVFC